MPLTKHFKTSKTHCLRILAHDMFHWLINLHNLSCYHTQPITCIFRVLRHAPLLHFIQRANPALHMKFANLSAQTLAPTVFLEIHHVPTW